MARPIVKQLALDTNILFDLARPLEITHEFREAFLAAGYLLRVPPTAVQELVFASEDEEQEPKHRALAARALKGMIGWQIKPFDLAAVGHGLTDAFAKKLLAKGLLPEREYNDGLILAETSLADIPMLVTRDKHLLDIDPTLLKLTFDECDLPHVYPAHPRSLWRAMRGA
jgi:hypothetical protein